MSRYARRENFAHPIRTPLLREHFVYRAYDAGGQLLYIGCSARLEARLRDHKVNSRWFGQVRRLRIAGPYNYETARQIECDAIESERSLHNYSSEQRRLRKMYGELVDYYLARHRAAFPERPFSETLSAAVEFADAGFGHYSARRNPPVVTDMTLFEAAGLKRDLCKVVDLMVGAA